MCQETRLRQTCEWALHKERLRRLLPAHLHSCHVKHKANQASQYRGLVLLREARHHMKLLSIVDDFNQYIVKFLSSWTMGASCFGMDDLLGRFSKNEWMRMAMNNQSSGVL